MSVSNYNGIPKQMTCWKWRDGKSTYAVERSPLVLTKDEPPSSPKVSVQEENVMFKRSDNKREITSSKIAERELMRQVGMNPFIQTDYVKGIEIRDKFLVPYHETKPSYDNTAEGV